MHNELYIIVFAKKGTMLGRRAYKTKKQAEEFLKNFGSPKDKYRIERYLPATIVEEIKDR